jgi:hypothetical protein
MNPNSNRILIQVAAKHPAAMWDVVAADAR